MPNITEVETAYLAACHKLKISFKHFVFFYSQKDWFCLNSASHNFLVTQIWAFLDILDIEYEEDTFSSTERTSFQHRGNCSCCYWKLLFSSVLAQKTFMSGSMVEKTSFMVHIHTHIYIYLHIYTYMHAYIYKNLL